MLEAVVVGLAGFVVVGTALPWLRAEIWWIRCWDFPRLQLAVLALLTAGAGAVVLALSGWLHVGVVVASLLCFLYQTIRILPYTRLAPLEVKWARNVPVERRLRILSANVLISNRETERFLALVVKQQPDIVVALEGDRRWEKQLDRLQHEHGYTHTIKHPLDNAYGMHVYSRLPLERTGVEFLVEREVPSMHAIVILRSGQRVQAHFIHPAPPSPTENERSTERDAELVIVAKRVAKERGPIVVTGDLNDVAWSTTTRLFRKLSRLLDPRIGRGMFNTFHARWFFVRWPLDHIFHSDDFTLVEMRRLPAIGSDHFPIFADLALEPERSSEQEAPQPDEDDRELADEKLEHAGKKPR
jgi:endonuclease/exonuclease/phosphatase (EEP) superfamily protein YafD